MFPFLLIFQFQAGVLHLPGNPGLRNWRVSACPPLLVVVCMEGVGLGLTGQELVDSDAFIPLVHFSMIPTLFDDVYCGGSFLLSLWLQVLGIRDHPQHSPLTQGFLRAVTELFGWTKSFLGGGGSGV
jgi:hypothetical protein